MRGSRDVGAGVGVPGDAPAAFGGLGDVLTVDQPAAQEMLVAARSATQALAASTTY